MTINTYLSIITLNFNGLNTPVKRQRGRLPKKTRAYNMLPTRDDLRAKYTYKLEMMDGKRHFM